MQEPKRRLDRVSEQKQERLVEVPGNCWLIEATNSQSLAVSSAQKVLIIVIVYLTVTTFRLLHGDQVSQVQSHL